MNERWVPCHGSELRSPGIVDAATRMHAHPLTAGTLVRSSRTPTTTKDAVTNASGVWVTFVGVLVLYLALGATLIITLRAMSRRWRSEADPEGDVPYGPNPGVAAGVSADGTA